MATKTFMTISYSNQKWLPGWLVTRASKRQQYNFKRLQNILKRQTASQFLTIATQGLSSPESLTRRELVLDDKKIEQYLNKFSENDRLGGPAAIRISHETARRVSLRLGRLFSDDFELPPATIAQALYYTVWSELCTLLPMRAIAREIAKTAGGDPILIHLDLKCKKYFSFWDQNNCECYYLYHELNRLGALPVFFLATRYSGKNSYLATSFRLLFSTAFKLRFSPGPFWKAPSFRVQNQSAIATIGMRAPEKVLSILGGLSKCEPAHSCLPFETSVFEPKTKLPTIELGFRKINRFVELIGYFDIYRADIPRHANNLIAQTLGKSTKNAGRYAREVVASQGISEAHICDHPFYQSSIVAGAVREAGGRTVVWPHSSNPIMIKMHNLNENDAVNTITNRGKNIWRKLMPAIKVQTISELMLTPYDKPWPFVDGDPLNIVVIAGAYRLGRLPVFSYSDHLKTYRRLFSEFSRHKGALRVHCKAKLPWEDFQFIQKLTPPELKLIEISDPPYKMEMTNLVFLTVTMGSTALLEGMGRGIPSFVVNETAVEDYAPIPTVVKTNQVSSILTRISDPSGWQSFVEDQSQWYNEQVEFGRL